MLSMYDRFLLWLLARKDTASSRQEDLIAVHMPQRNKTMGLKTVETAGRTRVF